MGERSSGAPGLSRARAAVGSAAFLVVAPGTMTLLVPWLLTGFESNDWWVGLRVLGGLLIAAGVPVLLHAFVRFVVEGLGTPAPVAPPSELVIGGVYRYVRNPMYVAVGSVIVGEGLALGQPILFPWAALFLAIVATQVKLHEEPSLQRQFGARYEEYKRACPAGGRGCGRGAADVR